MPKETINIGPQAGFQYNFFSAEKIDVVIGGGAAGCHSPDTLIYTKQGYKEIKRITEGELVLSVNPKTQLPEFKVVSEVFHYLFIGRLMADIEFADQKLTCTADHKFYINGAWKPITDIENSKSYLRKEYFNHGDLFAQALCNIKSIRLYYDTREMYDLGVLDNNNYTVTNKNILVHNCGKSFALLVDAARPIIYQMKGYWDIKKPYSATIFRRTYPEIDNPGGLWDESMMIYPYLGGVHTASNKEWSFYNRATRKEFAKIVFRHIQREEDKTNYQGSQLPFIGFDELTLFERTQFLYLLSRNRSMCGVRPTVRATCNPDADSWVADWIEWYIGDDGYIRKDRDGIVRYFTIDKDKLVWGDTKAEVIEKMAYKFADIPHENKEDLVKSFTFIEGDIHENQMLLKTNPQYLANLLALTEEEQLRLYRKNWRIKTEKNMIIDFKLFQNIFTNDFVAHGQKYITSDIATTGKDWLMIYVWSGKRLIDLDICGSNSGKEAIEKIDAMRRKHSVMNTNILYDADGVGNGMTGWITNCVEFHNNHTPIGKQNYRNLKSQCYFELAYCINQTNEKTARDMYYIEPNVANCIPSELFRLREPSIYRDRTFKWILEDQMKAIRKDKPDLDGKLGVIRKDEQKNLIHGLSPDAMDNFMQREYFERFSQNRFVNM